MSSRYSLRSRSRSPLPQDLPLDRSEATVEQLSGVALTVDVPPTPAFDAGSDVSFNARKLPKVYRPSPVPSKSLPVRASAAASRRSSSSRRLDTPDTDASVDADVPARHASSARRPPSASALSSGSSSTGSGTAKTHAKVLQARGTRARSAAAELGSTAAASTPSSAAAAAAAARANGLAGGSSSLPPAVSVPGAAPGAYDEVYSNEAVTTPLPASDTAPALLLSTAVCAAAAAADEPTAAPQSKRTRASTSDAGGAGSDVQLPTPMPAPAAPVVVVAASARNGGRSTRKRSFATTSDVDVCGTDPTGAGDASFAASAAGSSLAAISEIGESSDADDADAAADGADAGDVDADADADDATSDAAVCVDDSLPAPDADGFADDATVIEDAEDADAFDISFVEPVSPTPATAPTGGRSARASLTGLGSVAEATSFIPGADSDAGASPRALSFTSTEPAAIATTAAAAAEAARALLDVSTGYVSPARSTGPDADTGAPHTGANASFDAGELSARKRQQHSLVRRSLGADTAGDADADADSTAGDDTGLNASLLERCLSLPVTAASDAAADASEATAAAAEAAAATEEFGSAVPADSGPKKRRASPRSLKVRSRTAAAAVADDEAASVCSAASDASSGLPAPHGLLGPHNPSSPIPSKDPSLRRRRTGLTGGTALAMSDDDDATAAALALSVLPPSEIDGGQTYLDSLMPITPMSVRRAPARPQLAAGEAAEPGVAARLRFDAGADDDAAATEDAAPVNKSVVTASAPVPPLSEPDAAASEGIVTPSMSPLASASPRKRALGPREGSASSTPAVSAAAFAFAAVDAALAAGSAAPPSAASAAARPRPVANRGMCVPCSPTRRPPRAALKGSRAAAVAAGAVVAAPVASPTASPGTPGRSRRTLRFSHTHWAQFSIFPDWGKVPHDETVGCAVGLARVPLAAGVMTVKGRETLHPTVDSCSIDASVRRHAWREVFYIIKATAPVLLRDLDSADDGSGTEAKSSGAAGLPYDPAALTRASLPAVIDAIGSGATFFFKKPHSFGDLPLGAITVGTRTATLNHEATDMLLQVLNPTTAWHRLFVSLAEDLAARHCHSVADSPADALEPCPPRPLPPAPATRALARRFLATASLADFTDAGDLKRLKAQRGFAGCSCRRRVPLCPHRDYVFDAALVAALLPPPYGTGAAYPYHERLWLTPEERAAAAAGTLPPPDADAGADGEPPAEPYTGEVYETLDQMAYALAETLGLKEDTRVFTDSEGGLWSDDIESAAGDCKMCELLVWDRVGRCDNNFCPCLRSGVKCTADACACTSDCCKNPHGRHEFDDEKVSFFRHHVVRHARNAAMPVGSNEYGPFPRKLEILREKMSGMYIDHVAKIHEVKVQRRLDAQQAAADAGRDDIEPIDLMTPEDKAKELAKARAEAELIFGAPQVSHVEAAYTEAEIREFVALMRAECAARGAVFSEDGLPSGLTVVAEDEANEDAGAAAGASEEGDDVYSEGAASDANGDAHGHTQPVAAV